MEGKNMRYIDQLQLMIKGARESKNQSEYLQSWGYKGTLAELEKKYREELSFTDEEESGDAEGK